MPIYTYKAKDSNGDIVTERKEAANQNDLINQLAADGKYVLSVKEESKGGGKQKPKGPGKLKLKGVVNFCRQLASTLSAGIVLVRALSIVYEATEDKKVKMAIKALYDGVQKGQSLSSTMADLGNTFPDLLVNMVESGEASGNLDEIMNKMATHYEDEQKLTSKIKSSMIYPCVLGIMTVAVVIFMLTVILPQFTSTYADMEMPLPTRMLMAIGDFIGGFWWLIIIIIVAAVFAWRAIFALPGPRLWLDTTQLKLPVAGKLLRTIYTSRFASTFGLLYSSGISMLTCIDISSRVITNKLIQNKLNGVADKLKVGGMLSSSLREAGCFDFIFTAMVMTGEESGSLDDILQRTGKYFQDEADTAISNLVALMEPVMIVIMGVVIGFIVISIMLPMFGQYSQIH
jgi:type IV pilus assembly protein PilC